MFVCNFWIFCVVCACLEAIQNMTVSGVNREMNDMIVLWLLIVRFSYFLASFSYKMTAAL